MSTTFIATLDVKPGKEQEFERLQKELSELTHAHEPGTLVYDVIKSRGKPRTYVVYGGFADEAAFQASGEPVSRPVGAADLSPAWRERWTCTCSTGS